MPIEREVRALIQSKQDRLVPEIGHPSLGEVSEGSPALRFIPGKGVFLFFKFQEELYSLRMNKGLDASGMTSNDVARALGNGTSAMKALGFSDAVLSSTDEIGRNISISAGNIEDASISGRQIKTATITGTEIGTATISAENIASATITATQIANNTITATQIGSNTITAGEIASNTITADNIGSNVITAGEIASNAITAAKIASNAVTSGKIDTNAVTSGAIASSAVTSGKIATGAVTAGKIGDLEITAGKIANLTITASQIANLTIGNDQIATNSINANDKIVAASITATQIAADTITAGNIAADAVTASEIAANAVTASEIAAATITASEIAAATITATQIAAGTITATQIAANAVTATQIAANAVTASEINVSTLSAISANMGSVTAGDVNIGSGNFILSSGGDATFSDGRFFFHQTGDMYIKPKYGENEGEATRRGLIFTEPLDSGGSWSEYWMMWHFSDNVFSLAYNGTPQLQVTSGGNLTVAGDLIAGDQVVFGSTVHSSYLDWKDDSYDGPSLHGGSDVYYFKPHYESDNYPYWGLQLGSPDNRWERLYALEASDISSDSRWKRNIETVPLGLDFINSLNPVQYNRYAIGSEEDPDGKIIEGKHWGLIAQEVKASMEEAGISDEIAWHYPEDSDRYSLSYTELISPMIKAIQELKQEVEALKS